MFDGDISLCQLIVYAIFIIIIVAAYRYVVDGVMPWKSSMKSGFMDSSAGCGSCQYLAKDLGVTKA